MPDGIVTGAITPEQVAERASALGHLPSLRQARALRHHSKAGAGSGPYAVFASMLAGGNPPDDWPALLEAARAPEAERRFGAVER